MLIAQEKKSGEVLALRFQVLDETLHEVLKHLHHEWHILPQTFSLAKLLIRLATAFSVVYLFTVNPIYGHELFVLLRHVMCYVPLSKNWKQVGPVLLEIVPNGEEVCDPFQVLL